MFLNIGTRKNAIDEARATVPISRAHVALDAVYLLAQLQTTQFLCWQVKKCPSVCFIETH